MSSLVRRIEKRAMKKSGFVRTKYVLVMGEDGKPRQSPVTKGGLILDGDNNPVGYQWPRAIAAEPARLIKRKYRPARGRRRGKPSTWRSGRGA